LGRNAPGMFLSMVDTVRCFKVEFLVMTRDSDDNGRPNRGRRNPKTLLAVAFCGAATTESAYLLSFGSLIRFVFLLIAFAVLLRVGARVILARRGERPPRGWWL
jgi:hypothetical protein